MLERPPGLDIEQLFLAIYRLITGGGDGVGAVELQAKFFAWWVKVAFVSSILTPILLVALAYVLIRYQQLRMEEMEKYRAKAKPLRAEERVAPEREAWDRIMELVSSTQPNDWRVAVLEADVMLDGLLKAQGLPGENLGERLKAIDRSDMRSLNSAWEAHKIRNQIAHGGGDVILTQREARRAIENFRDVFEEFGLI